MRRLTKYEEAFPVRLGEPNDRTRLRNHGEIVRSQVSQELPERDLKVWVKDLLRPESSLERAERLVREDERLRGVGPTSLAYATRLFPRRRA